MRASNLVESVRRSLAYVDGYGTHPQSRVPGVPPTNEQSPVALRQPGLCVRVMGATEWTGVLCRAAAESFDRPYVSSY
jgi:hypothetical protein